MERKDTSELAIPSRAVCGRQGFRTTPVTQEEGPLTPCHRDTASALDKGRPSATKTPGDSVPDRDCWQGALWPGGRAGGREAGPVAVQCSLVHTVAPWAKAGNRGF